MDDGDDDDDDDGGVMQPEADEARKPLSFDAAARHTQERQVHAEVGVAVWRGKICDNLRLKAFLFSKALAAWEAERDRDSADDDDQAWEQQQINAAVSNMRVCDCNGRST